MESSIAVVKERERDSCEIATTITATTTTSSDGNGGAEMSLSEWMASSVTHRVVALRRSKREESRPLMDGGASKSTGETPIGTHTNTLTPTRNPVEPPPRQEEERKDENEGESSAQDNHNHNHNRRRQDRCQQEDLAGSGTNSVSGNTDGRSAIDDRSSEGLDVLNGAGAQRSNEHVDDCGVNATPVKRNDLLDSPSEKLAEQMSYDIERYVLRDLQDKLRRLRGEGLPSSRSPLPPSPSMQPQLPEEEGPSTTVDVHSATRTQSVEGESPDGANGSEIKKPFRKRGRRGNKKNKTVEESQEASPRSPSPNTFACGGAGGVTDSCCDVSSSGPSRDSSGAAAAASNAASPQRCLDVELQRSEKEGDKRSAMRNIEIHNNSAPIEEDNHDEDVELTATVVLPCVVDAPVMVVASPSPSKASTMTRHAGSAHRMPTFELFMSALTSMWYTPHPVPVLVSSTPLNSLSENDEGEEEEDAKAPQEMRRRAYWSGCVAVAAGSMRASCEDLTARAGKDEEQKSAATGAPQTNGDEKDEEEEGEQSGQKSRRRRRRRRGSKGEAATDVAESANTPLPLPTVAAVSSSSSSPQQQQQPSSTSTPNTNAAEKGGRTTSAIRSSKPQSQSQSQPQQQKQKLACAEKTPNQKLDNVARRIVDEMPESKKKKDPIARPTTAAKAKGKGKAGMSETVTTSATQNSSTTSAQKQKQQQQQQQQKEQAVRMPSTRRCPTVLPPSHYAPYPYPEAAPAAPEAASYYSHYPPYNYGYYYNYNYNNSNYYCGGYDGVGTGVEGGEVYEGVEDSNCSSCNNEISAYGCCNYEDANSNAVYGDENGGGTNQYYYPSYWYPYTYTNTNSNNAMGAYHPYPYDNSISASSMDATITTTATTTATTLSTAMGIMPASPSPAAVSSAPSHNTTPSLSTPVHSHQPLASQHQHQRQCDSMGDADSVAFTSPQARLPTPTPATKTNTLSTAARGVSRLFPLIRPQINLLANWTAPEFMRRRFGGSTAAATDASS